MGKATISVDPEFNKEVYDRVMKEYAGLKGYSDERIKKEQALFDELAKLGENLSGTQVNRMVSFSQADGSANYIIAKVGPRTCTLLHLPFFDGYASPAVTHNHTCPRSVVDRQLNLADFMEEHRKKHHNESDNFYATLKPGDIVHYEDVFVWLRCEVVPDGNGVALKPIALVGNKRVEVDGKWEGDYFEVDLFTVSRTGQVTYMDRARMILDGHHLKPNVASIYECPARRKRPNEKDPRTLPVAPLHPEEFTPEQKRLHKQWADLEIVLGILQNQHSAPLSMMIAAQKQLAIILDEY